jgi:IS30 family transposase
MRSGARSARSIRLFAVWRHVMAGSFPRRSLRTPALAEREDISCGIAFGSSIRGIAKAPQRAAAKVDREVAGHGGRPLGRANEADPQAWESALRPKACFLAVHVKLQRVVASKMLWERSPQQISAWLKIQYPEDESLRVSGQDHLPSLIHSSARSAEIRAARAPAIQAPHPPLRAL